MVRIKSKDKVKRNWYNQILQKFIDFVGEPSEDVFRDNLLLVMAIVYIICGIVIKLFPDNIIMNILTYKNQTRDYLLIAVLETGGIFMLMDWLFWLIKNAGKSKEKR